MNKEELKNCPFCGGEAIKRQIPGRPSSYITEIICNNCRVTAPTIDRWNRRADSDDDPEYLKSVKGRTKHMGEKQKKAYLEGDPEAFNLQEVGFGGVRVGGKNFAHYQGTNLGAEITLTMRDLVEFGNRCWWEAHRFWKEHSDGQATAKTIKEILEEYLSGEPVDPDLEKGFEQAYKQLPTVTIWAYRQVSSGVWIISTDKELADGECYRPTEGSEVEFDRFEVYAGWKPDSLYRYTVREVGDE